MANLQGQAFEDLRNTVNECARIVRHRWQLALIGLTGIGTLAFWCSQYLPREYSAATLFERRDDVVLQNLINSRSPYSFEHLKTTMSMDMTGTRALGLAMVRCGLLPEDTFTNTEAITDHERSAISGVMGKYQLQPRLKLLHSTPNLDTIRLSCTANDPVVAQKVVVALRDNYIEQTRERIREILNGTQEFFESEVDRLEERAASAEHQLAEDFEAFPGLDPTDVAGAGNRLEVLRAQRDNLYQRKAELDAELSAREAFLKNSPAPDPFVPTARRGNGPSAAGEAAEEPPPSSSVAALETTIRNVQQEIVDLMTMRGMTREHPEVKRRYARLEALQELRVALLDNEAQEPPTPAPQPELVSIPTPEISQAYRQWEAQRMRVELELEALRRQATLANEQLREADERLVAFEKLYARLLDKEGDIQELMAHGSEARREANVWRGHLTSLERVLKAEAGQRGTQFTLLEQPQDVTRPTKPKVASVFVFCSALGIAAAALMIALAELFDRSFRSVGQVTRVLGLPVLECVAVVPTPREKRKIAMRRLLWAPTVAVLLGALAISASLAYASLQMPSMHKRAMQRVNGLLGNVSITAVAPPGDSVRPPRPTLDESAK